MGYWLLWIESLTASLLLVAGLLALAARLSNRWLRTAVWLLGALVPLTIYAVLTVLAGYLKFEHDMAGGLFYHLLALTLIYLAGTVWLRLAGFSSAADGTREMTAATWPCGRLWAALLVVAALNLMTFWNLDLAVQQRVAAIRVESGALALSVAPARVPDSENASLLYQQAFKAMGDTGAWPKALNDWNIAYNPQPEPLDTDDPELREFLRQKAPAISLLQVAAERPQCYFERDYVRPSIDMRLPELQQLRLAARLLAADARVKAADGISPWQNIKAIFAMAEHAGNEPIVISMLVAISMEKVAFGTLQATVGAEESPRADLADLYLDSNLSYQRLLERATRLEQAFGASLICDVATGQLDVAQFEELIGYRACLRPLVPLYRVLLLADDVASQQRYMTRFRRIVAMPYYQAKVPLDKLAHDLRCNPGGPLNSLLWPALHRSAEIAAEGDARHAVALVALAALRYQSEKDRLPTNAKELVPNQLLYVSTDPFDGSPIKLKRSGKTLRIYSVGPDGKDDGGAPFEEEKRKGDIVFTLPG